jgi:hypothetical protein
VDELEVGVGVYGGLVGTGMKKEIVTVIDSMYWTK